MAVFQLSRVKQIPEQLRTAQAQGQPYHLIILNDDIFDMNGWALAQAIKADANLGSIRVILLSAFKRYESDSVTRQAQITAVLAKPVRQSVLYNGLISTLELTNVDRSIDSFNPSSADLHHRINARVFVVEDNIVNQKVAVRLLERMGCRVDAAAHGREALSMLSRLTYDIVFMDCQMPEMDGFTATAMIRNRETPSGFHIPIVAMTANTMEGDRERCLDAGMDDYLSKPVQSDLLLAMLQKWAPGPIEPPRRLEAEGLPESYAVSPADSTPALDTPTCSQLQAIEDDAEPRFLDRDVETFVNDATLHIDNLRAAAARGDTAAIEHAAQTLKSTSMQIGAVRMSALCLELQLLGRQNNFTGTEAYIDQLASELDRVPHRLAQEFLNRPPRKPTPSPE